MEYQAKSEAHRISVPRLCEDRGLSVDDIIEQVVYGDENAPALCS